VHSAAPSVNFVSMPLPFFNDLLVYVSSVGGLGTAIAIHIEPVFDNFIRFEGISAVWLGCALGGNTLIIGLTIRHFVESRDYLLDFRT
jgi:hypothetical protein